jgi:hypothetical protein
MFVIYMYSAAPPLGWILHLICASNAALSGAIKEEALSRTTRMRGFAATTRPRA